MNKKAKLTVRNQFTRVKTARGRKLSSKNWLQRQLNDPYVKQSKVDGYRSRAAYKLVEINNKFNILGEKFNVLDLGCAPGSWTQVIQQHNPQIVIAVDLLEIEPINDVEFIQGDFLEEEVHNKITEILEGKKINLILSDIAPNTTGHKDTDQLRIMAVAESIFEFSKTALGKDGSMVIKIFQGAGFPEFVKDLKIAFKKVNTYKPDASRSGSPEIYIVATGRK
ncbi:MAG: RlmE family RNA methyltransferase [Rickettsiales bacterium]